MTRAFRPDPVDVTRVLDAGRRAPAAGNAVEARRFLLIENPADYWAVTLPDPAGFAFPGLLAAPVLVVVLCSPGAYAARYAEADKGGSRLGRGAAAWPQPFWWFDAGAAAEAMLLAAREEGLGACLFGLFEHEMAVLDRFRVPAGWRGACTIAFGRAAESQPPGRSASRRRPSLEEVVLKAPPRA